MAGETVLPASIPFESTIAIASAQPELGGDIVATAEYLAESLDARAEIIRIGLLGMAEIEGYYEGGLPEDVRNSLFLLYLSYQNIELTNMVSGLYGDRFSRDQFANASHLLREIRTSTDQEIAFARGRYMYFTGQQQPAVAQQKQAAVAHAEHLIDTGENIDSVDDFLRNMGIDSDTIDGRAIRSKRAVEAQMLPTADETLVALSRLGYSDTGIFRRLAIATGNFARVGETDFGTYAMQVHTAVNMLAQGEQPEVVKGATGIPDADFEVLVEYLQTEKPETARKVSHELVELGKQGLPINEWYRKLRELHIGSGKIVRHPLYVVKVLAPIAQRIRDGVDVKRIEDEHVLPRQVIAKIADGQREYRSDLYRSILSLFESGALSVVQTYSALRAKGFGIREILRNDPFFRSLQEFVLQLQQEGFSWKEIETNTGISARALQDISKDAVKKGIKKPSKVGDGGMTSVEWDDLDARVLDCINQGITTYADIATTLGIKQWQAHHATVRLIKTGKTTSRRFVKKTRF